jgi:hypothetical protein
VGGGADLVAKVDANVGTGVSTCGEAIIGGSERGEEEEQEGEARDGGESVAVGRGQVNGSGFTERGGNGIVMSGTREGTSVAGRGGSSPRGICRFDRHRNGSMIERGGRAKEECEEGTEGVEALSVGRGDGVLGTVGVIGWEEEGITACRLTFLRFCRSEVTGGRSRSGYTGSEGAETGRRGDRVDLEQAFGVGTTTGQGGVCCLGIGSCLRTACPDCVGGFLPFAESRRAFNSFTAASHCTISSSFSSVVMSCPPIRGIPPGTILGATRPTPGSRPDKTSRYPLGPRPAFVQAFFMTSYSRATLNALFNDSATRRRYFTACDS